MSGPTHLRNARYKRLFHGHGYAESIGLSYLSACLSRQGYRLETSGRLHLKIRLPGQCQAVWMLSGMTSEWNQVVKLARRAKADGSITVAGGYHVCGLPQRCFDGGLFDYVVRGEGEEACVTLMDHLAHGPAASTSSTRGEHGFPTEIRASRIESLDNLPRPYRAERALSVYKLLDLMWPPASTQRNVALILASRGCVHSCDFCASASVWRQGIRVRSPANVVAELADLKNRFATNTIVFIDQSLGQASRWTLELCSAIREARLGISWYHQSNLTIDRDVLKAMARAGCTKIGFGMEGMSPRAIERLKPHNPHDCDFINDLFDYCNSLGLFVKVYLMLGSPWETEQDIEEYRRCIGRIRANEVKISYFTPFPGTRAWEQYETQLVTQDWSAFDTVAMPVVFNPRISVSQYHAIRAELFQTFYGSPTYHEVTANMLRQFPHYVESYREFVDYLRAFDMITGGESWLDLLGLNREYVSLACREGIAGGAACS